ncbi:MAG: hypothetical protein US30_C0013G0069 [Candidatus Moranbacteria bacterium GW2011_GWF2_36_839]|nr:MAG: hypothetical protein US27_C0013G0069 [Candidatus Moranbacteria bacterium GW2011_GWF1_36_78]KKQ16672.1 MAG: hypothetical protein US30_C0013G0069 [Candidatus Moranbacteria bacterium GW2011_GWF2_36_839]
MATEPIIQATAVPIGICTNSVIKEVSFELAWPLGVHAKLVRNIYAEELGLMPKKSSAIFFIPSNEIEDMEIEIRGQSIEDTWVGFWTKNGLLNIQWTLKRVRADNYIKLIITTFQGEKYELALDDAVKPFLNFIGTEVIQLPDGTRGILVK